jgi:phosphoglucosamine mutase
MIRIGNDDPGRRSANKKDTQIRRFEMGKYFGTDGFRGEANKKLTVEHAFKVGRFLGWYYGQDYKARIVIGKDTRRSSYMFEYALAAGLTASGADAFLLHVTTTPSVSYVVRTEDFDCGIMISASHNPYYDNGLKIISGSGKKIEAEVEEKIEAYIDGEIGELPLATGENIGRTVDYVAGRNRYIGHLIALATRSFKNTRVGLDCANGSASSIAKSVFDALGAKTYVIHNEPDGTNINRGCGSTHIEELKNFVLEKGLDVGFAFDGDADRCIAVDQNGRIIDGDLILYICGKYLKEEGQLANNTVVTTIMSNLGLYKAFDKAGIAYEKTAVGDKYVYANMCANGHCIGGEQSGHIIFSKYATTGDGILTALMVMGVMMDKKVSLATLASEVRIYPQLLKNVRVADKQAVKDNEAVQAAVKAAADALGEDGRILVRESGTEPVIRVMVEADTDELCAQYVNSVIDVIKEQGLTED